MMCKIIGNSLAGILQFAIWAIVGTIIFFVVSSIFGTESAAASMVKSNPEALKLAIQKAGLMAKIPLYIAELWNLPLATILP